MSCLMSFKGLSTEEFHHWATENNVGYVLVCKRHDITGYRRGVLTLIPRFTVWIDQDREVEAMLTWADHIEYDPR